jgi:hypothetical protein
MIIFGMEARTSLGSESAITGKQGDVFGFGMLVLEAVVGKKKKLDLTGGMGEMMGLLGFASARMKGERRVFLGFWAKRVMCHARSSVSIHLNGTK